MSENKVSVLASSLKIVGTIQNGGCICEAHQHQAVPTRQNFFVAMRFDALFTFGKELSATALNKGVQFFGGQAFLVRKLRHRDRNIQDVLAFEVASMSDIKIAAEHLCV